MDIKPIVDFVVKNSPHKDKKLIKEVIKKHIEYKTCVILFDKDNKVVAVVRWNMVGLTVAHILDLIIREDYRNKNLIKRLLLKGIKMFPTIRAITYEREQKDDRIRTFTIERFL